MTTGPVPVEPSRSGDAAAGAAAVAGHRDAARARRLRLWLPAVALLVGLLVALWLYASRPEPETAEPEPVVPLVRVESVTPRPYRFEVTAHGTVVPRAESDLVAEVRGRVVEVAPSLVAGGFFAKGDTLLRLDDREYRIALQRARASVALRRSEARLAAAEAARRVELAKRGAASTADLEQFESRAQVADAALEEALATLDQAELDLERTVVRAPFDGRVHERNVDVGQFVSPGTRLGHVQATDAALVRLPIATDDLAFVDVPLGGEAADGEELGAPVRLQASLGGRTREWAARLVRSEREIDPRTRTLHVVARVDDPYRRHGSGPGVPLPTGLFVTATISGRQVEGAFVLPPMALRDGDRVFLADDEDRLEVREVGVARRGRNEIVVGSGLRAGDRVIVSPLRVYSRGMPLHTVSTSEAADGAPGAGEGADGS